MDEENPPLASQRAAAAGSRLSAHTAVEAQQLHPSQSQMFNEVRFRKTVSKTDLKSRLYDKGISAQTMPSVKRPNVPQGQYPVQVKTQSQHIASAPNLIMAKQKGHGLQSQTPPQVSSKAPRLPPATSQVIQRLPPAGQSNLLKKQQILSTAVGSSRNLGGTVLTQSVQGHPGATNTSQLLSRNMPGNASQMSFMQAVNPMRTIQTPSLLSGQRHHHLQGSNINLKTFQQEEVEVNSQIGGLAHLPSMQTFDMVSNHGQSQQFLLPPRPSTMMSGMQQQHQDITRAPSQLNLNPSSRPMNPQFTPLNMAPYHRPQSQAFGYRGGSFLQRDPSKKTLKPSEEVTSITGLKTMSALGPKTIQGEKAARHTSFSQAEEIMKRRAQNTKAMKRLIVTSLGKDTIQEDYMDQKRALLSDRLNKEDQEKRIQHMLNSPVRKGDDGPVTFIGKQENDDEILRQHFLMQKMRGAESMGGGPHIERDNPALKKRQQDGRAKTAFNQHRQSAALNLEGLQDLLDKHQMNIAMNRRGTVKNVKAMTTLGGTMPANLQRLLDSGKSLDDLILEDNNEHLNLQDEASNRGSDNYQAISARTQASNLPQQTEKVLAKIELPPPSTWKDLDKLITLLQSQAEDDGYFIYLKPSPIANNPYDLQPMVDIDIVANSQSKQHGQAISKRSLQLQTSKLEKFYTLSRKGITTYQNDEPVDYITLTDWLIERNYYQEIRGKRFFHEFRRWKVLRMWRRNILHKKREEVKSALTEKLFFLDPVFCPIILNHRGICKDLEQLRLLNMSPGPVAVGNEALTLIDFKKNQKAQRDMIGKKIQDASHVSRVRFRQGITAVLDDLRAKINEFNAQEGGGGDQDQEAQNFSHMKGGSMISKIGEGAIKEKRGMSQDPVYEQLGFKSNMKYGPRSKLRRACTRFLRFSYLLDFVALEALSNIFIESVKDTVKKLIDLSGVHPDFELKKVQRNALGEVINTTAAAVSDKNTSGAHIGKKGLPVVSLEYLMVPPPLFKVSAVFHPIAIRPNSISPGSEGIPLKLYKQIKVPSYMPGISKQNTFDPTVHIEIQESKHQDDDEEVEEIDQFAVDSEEKTYERTKIEGLHDHWLSIEPSQCDFASMLRESLQDDGIDCLRRFERYSRHHELLPYVRVLESWDDKVVDGEWEPPDDNHLRCDEWLQDNYWFINLDFIIDKYLTSAYGNVNRFFINLEPFLQGFWENKRLIVDFDRGQDSTLANEHLKNPLDIIPLVLQRFNDQKTDSETMIPPYRDLGLLRLVLNGVKDVLTPQAKLCFSKLKQIFPLMLRTRIENLKSWLNNQIKAISKPPINVQSYVKQVQALEYIEKHYQGVKDRIETNVNLFGTFMQFEIESKEEKNRKFVDEVYSIQISLNTAIAKAKDSADNRKDQMKQKIQMKIPKLMDQVGNFSLEVFREELLDINQPFYDTLAKVCKMEEMCDELNQKSKDIHEFQKTLDMDVSKFDMVEEVRVAMLYRMKLWRSLDEWGNVLVEKWRTAPFERVDVSEITQKSEYYTKVALQCERNLPVGSSAVARLKQLVFDFRETMPIVEALGNKNLKVEHWTEIKTIIGLGQDYPMEDKQFNLGELIGFGVAKYQEEIINVSVTATQEFNLRTQLDEIKVIWSQTDFRVAKHKDRADCFKLTELDVVQGVLDESLTAVSNIMGSRYVKRLQAEAEMWQQRLNLVADTIEAWKEFQRAWLYLDNIFASPDIRRNRARDAQDFENISRNWNKIMKQVNAKSNVLHNCQNGKFLSDFLKYNMALDRIQKNLDAYLEEKRMQFPRFYFLSNDELLQILANAADIKSVEKHLNKCFENICGLLLIESGGNIPDIGGMVSGEREEVEFPRIKVGRPGQGVEQWMNQIESSMQSILLRKIKEAHINYYDAKVSRKEWVLGHIGQAIATVAQITWTEGCELAILDMEQNPFSLQDYVAALKDQLSQLTQHIQNPNLPGIKRRILVSLITTDVHARDIVEDLSNEGVEAITDFNWQQQLRYYIEEEKVKVRQVNAQIDYGYEYMGATSRLVITPLTDRCWMTITGAMHIKLGAAPAGPAGTGKTESTKDLAKALGIYCVVFNCSDQIEYKMMARLFSGLAQSGAWSCLDEFNRIDVEVLSVIAQQLLDIREAKLQNKARFLFNNCEMALVQTCGVFVTMNPGYAGRTELPDNLKVLFRPVSMMIPNYGLIAEIMLFAEGFENAKTLSTKMVQLYKLASEQLSQQDHYDFGMRAVKSVLVMAGTLKRANPTLSEDVVLIRAMRDSNIPKFLAQDLPLFSALIQDLFPGIQIPEANYGELQIQIEKSLSDLGLQYVPAFATKVIQLFDTFNVRFGVMIVGPAGGGKSTCCRVLGHSMTALRNEKMSTDPRFQEVRYKVLNPKSITMGELYGEENVDTKEWTDGLASKIIRKFAKDDENAINARRSWCVFDGPVDALWIENMNTVLDDNMTLCLANGERIKLKWSMRMLFEVQDLAVASPATVSRCGMVYMTPSELGWKPYLYSWLKSFAFAKELLHEESAGALEEMFSFYFEECWTKLKAHVKDEEPMPTVPIQIVRCICNFLEYFLLSSKQAVPINDKKEVWLKKLNYYFGFAFIWGFGASYKASALRYVDNIMREFFGKLHFPLQETVFEYYFNEKEQRFVHWQRIVPSFSYDPKVPFFSLMVPTVETVRYTTLLEMLLSIGKPVFFTGSTGVGKSVIIQNYLSANQDKQQLAPIQLTFSAQTNSNSTQQTIEAKLEKKRGKKCIGSKGNSTCVLFVDDVNMPMVETYGAQPPIELLRQLLDQGGFYDRPAFFWKVIEKFNILCAAAPPGGGRSALTPRFMRHFHVFNLPDPSEDAMRSIFDSILREFLIFHHFPESVRKAGNMAVAATVDLFTQITNNLLPIPAKFHYTFNLRDVAKVFQGMLMTKPISVTTLDTFARLWLHECSRVFNDRLINDQDRSLFRSTVADLLKSKFKVNWNMKEADPFAGPTQVIFGFLLRLDAEEQLYEDIADKKKLFKTLEDKLMDYNITCSSQKMDLVFFDDAIAHLCRVSRILRQPRGNAMLIGVSGCGKQSLTRLGSFMLECKCFQIKLSKSYKPSHFREDIKVKMLDAGCDGTQCTFLMTDTQIMYESFLEDINNILNTGEITNLYGKEDFDRMYGSLTKVNQGLKRPETKDGIYQTFIERVRDNFHIILCMSPVGDTLRIRCRKFPSLVTCCTLDWFDSWPEEALLSVSQRFLTHVQDTLANTKEEQDVMKYKLARMFTQVHRSVEEVAQLYWEEMRRKVYVTPKSYLDGITMYLKQLDTKKDEAKLNISRLSNGCTKLKDTNLQIASLKVSLADLIPKLEEENLKAGQQAIVIQENNKIAFEKEAVVEKESAIVQQDARDIEKLKKENDVELAKCKPALEEAERAVNALSKDDITELKTFKQPPEVVETALRCVFLYLGYPKQEWKQALTIISDIKFLDRLKSYDNKNIPPKTIMAVRQMMVNESFKPDEMMTKSKVAGGLAKWGKAMYEYAEAWKIVKPKELKQLELSEKLKVAEREVAVKRDELAIVQGGIAKMEAEYNKLMDYIQDLSDNKTKSERRLKNAGKLIDLLGDEGERWEKSVGVQMAESEKLVGDVFIAAAQISYMGPFTGSYRDKLVEKWIQICHTEQVAISDKYSLVNTLGDAVEIRNWGLCSLPSDAVSIDNGILATKTSRWPLMIDPQNQANTWIKKMCKASGDSTEPLLRVVKLSDGASYQKQMEQAIIAGATVLIEDVSQELDPGLDAVLNKAVYREEGLDKINFGERPIIYDKRFKLFITTKLPNPHFLPEISIKVTIINFTVTFDGLEEQMLVDVVINEAPEVEKKRDNLVLEISGSKNELKRLEIKILKDLAESNSETILDNQDLIDTLEISKEKSKLISESLIEAEEVEKTINETRNSYKEVSVRGSILYFVISDLAMIDPMYQNSLSYVKKLFNDAIVQSPAADTLKKRIEVLMKFITETLYVNICRGLFEQHKLLFSFLICTSIKRKAHEINENTWNLLLRGAGLFNKAEQPHKPQSVAHFMSDAAWDLAFCASKAVPDSFGGLCQIISDNPKAWEDYAMNNERDYFTAMPCGYAHRAEVSMFDKLLLLKIFKPEKLMFAFQRYVGKALGKQYAESPVATMDSLFGSSDNHTPIIFVLSQGADPTEQVIGFAKKMNYYDRFYYKSLGQGQERVASEMIQKGKDEGNWVLLQNCHLFKSWMPALEVICERIREDPDVHPDFRLIMTSMPADYFPGAILQNGLKMTTEPPRGIKANLKRSYTNLITEETYVSCMSGKTNNQAAFNKLLFGLCFFHASVQERRKFGPLGWNIRYEFNDSDLDTSIKMLRNFLIDNEAIPWDAMRYMTGQINYGGRVTDDWDRTLLLHILNRFYNEKVVPRARTDSDDDYDEESDNEGSRTMAKQGSDYLLNSAGVYKIFDHKQLGEVHAYIETLPPTEEPEIFGLHPNANIAFQKQETEKILDNVLNVQPRVVAKKSSDGQDAKSSEDVIFELAKELEAGVPPLIDKDEHAKDIFKPNNKGLLHCLSTVLLQEIERYNKLLMKMTSSLVLLSKAIKGLVIMSPELDLMSSALLKNQVPPNWQAVAYPSLKPLASWVRDLNERVEFMRGWLKGGHPPCYWLSGFFFPHGFMTGTLQTYARKHLKPIDQLGYRFRILKEYLPEKITKAPRDGIYVYGLFIEGAHWSSEWHFLDEQAPGEMTSAMPAIHFLPRVLPDKEKLQQLAMNPELKKAMKANKARDSEDPSSSEDELLDAKYSKKYKCPVYKTSVRAGTLSTTGQSTNFILAVDLPMEKAGLQAHWSLRGTALLSMLND